jgi:hypothetical protein
MTVGKECSSRKRMFPTRSSIKDFIRENKAQHLRNGIRALHYYECAECGNWHLTKQFQYQPKNKTK